MNKEIEICITKGVIECKNVAIIPVSNFNLSSLLCCQVGCGLEFAHEQVDGESEENPLICINIHFNTTTHFMVERRVVPSLLIHPFMENERLLIEIGSSLNFPPLVYRH